MRYESLKSASAKAAWTSPDFSSVALSPEEVEAITKADNPREALVASCRRHGLLSSCSFADLS
jgi:hypothetical protein